MSEEPDGTFQKYSVESGAYIRKHFFGKYPELLEMVKHLTNDDLTKLNRSRLPGYYGCSFRGIVLV